MTAAHNNKSNAQLREATRKELRNEDPLSGEAGAHPVGTGVGAALGGAAAGAAAGAVAGPIGAVVGAAAGAVLGGLGGKSVAESMDPTIELEYWRNEHKTRAYYDAAVPYNQYESAYRIACEAYEPGKSFAQVEDQLMDQWQAQCPDSALECQNARSAMKDAWDRCAQQCCQEDAASCDQHARRSPPR